MAGGAIAVRTFQVRGVIEGYVPILGDESELLGRSFFVLSKRPERSAYADGEKTCNDSTHARKVALFRLRAQHGTLGIGTLCIGAAIAYLFTKGAVKPMNLTPYIVLWSLLGLLVLGLALYRKLIALHEEDDLIHISEGEQRLIPHQVAVNAKIHTIDRWGEVLTVATVAGGLMIAAVYLYGAWQANQTLR